LIFSHRLGWIGVDIGTRTVKLAQAVRTADGVRLHQAVVVQRTTPWPDEDALGQGEPDRSEVEIRAALECGSFSGRNAACMLPMNVCELRGLNVPHGDERERRAMIANELAEDWAERPAAMEFDYWELDADRDAPAVDGFNINVLAIARPWITRVASDCQKARLDCWAVDGEPLATARAVGLAANLRGSARALAIDWGFSNVTLSVVGGDRALYVRRIPQCGFHKCLESIQAALGVTLDQAQHLASTEGVVSPDSDASGRSEIQTAITAATADTIDALVEQIRRTQQFVELQRRHLRPTSVWLLGGGGSLRNIGPHLSLALNLPVSIWNLPVEHGAGRTFGDGQAALFGNAVALSALAWRAA
jgi:Tfp pilus assembly PilM family ATPase